MNYWWTSILLPTAGCLMLFSREEVGRQTMLAHSRVSLHPCQWTATPPLYHHHRKIAKTSQGHNTYSINHRCTITRLPKHQIMTIPQLLLLSIMTYKYSFHGIVHKMKSFCQTEIELFYCHDFSCLAKIRFHSTPVWVTMHLFWMIGYEQFVSHAVKNVDVSLMLVINIVAGKAMHWKHARRLLLMRKRDSSQLCTLSKHFPTAFLSRIIVKAF